MGFKTFLPLLLFTVAPSDSKIFRFPVANFTVHGQFLRVHCNAIVKLHFAASSSPLFRAGTRTPKKKFSLQTIFPPWKQQNFCWASRGFKSPTCLQDAICCGAFPSASLLILLTFPRHGNSATSSSCFPLLFPKFRATTTRRGNLNAIVISLCVFETGVSTVVSKSSS